MPQYKCNVCGHQQDYFKRCIHDHCPGVMVQTDGDNEAWERSQEKDCEAAMSSEECTCPTVEHVDGLKLPMVRDPSCPVHGNTTPCTSCGGSGLPTTRGVCPRCRGNGIEPSTPPTPHDAESVSIEAVKIAMNIHSIWDEEEELSVDDTAEIIARHLQPLCEEVNKDTELIAGLRKELADLNAHFVRVEAEGTKEVERLKTWVNDLQSGMYVNCVYCGHRYGPGETTPVSMADALKAHVETCKHHPMNALREEVERLRARAQAAEGLAEETKGWMQLSDAAELLIRACQKEFAKAGMWQGVNNLEEWMKAKSRLAASERREEEATWEELAEAGLSVWKDRNGGGYGIYDQHYPVITAFYTFAEARAEATRLLNERKQTCKP